MKEELLKGLTEEQIAKVKACKSREELLKIAKEEGVELSDEQLNAVSGGACYDNLIFVECPNCGWIISAEYNSKHTYTCDKCGTTTTFD